MSGRGPRLAALGLAAALLSCASRASVVVHVETDISWGTGADNLMRSIRVRVYSGVGDQTPARYDYTAPLGRQPGTVPIPVRFGVLPLNNDASRTVTVRVDGCADTACRAEGSVIVTQHAIFSFIEGEQRELPMFLAMSCQRMPCSFPQTTCRMGACVDPRIPPEQLVPSAWGFYDASAARDTAAADVAPVDAMVADVPVVDTPSPDAPPVIDVATDTLVADARDASVADVRDVTDAPPLDARTDATDAPAMDLFTTDARDVTGPDTFDAGSVDVRDATVADIVDAPTVDVRDGGSTDAVDVFDNGLPCLCRSAADCPRPRFNCCDTLVTNRCGTLDLALLCVADLTCR